MLLQRRFMTILGIQENNHFHYENLLSAPEFVSASIGVISEGTEILNVLNSVSRPWKTAIPKEEIRQELMEELIDVQFYVLELYNILNMDEFDVMSQYLRKLTINMARVFKRVTVEERREYFTEAWESGRDFDEREPMQGTQNQEAALAVVTAIHDLMPEATYEEVIDELSVDPIAFVRKMFAE